MSNPKTITPSPVDRVLANHRAMADMVARAQALLESGRLEQSAVWLQIAATFGWFNHPGLFTHPQLEKQLAALSEVVQKRASARGLETTIPPARDRDRRVMHVATQLYPTGGHTQMISRWVAEDSRSQSMLVLTRQGARPVPAKIASLIPDISAGLDSRHNSLLARAVELRRAAASADVVIIHAHPDDVVPAIALAASDIPCIVVNHADHVFWAGASAAKTVLHMRRSGQELAERRRGLPAGRGLLMNRPLEAPTHEPRATAREKWGVSPDEVLLVTAAAASKYVPLDGVSLVDMLTEASRREPTLRVLAAGPDPEGPWLAAAQHTQGRVRALGRVEGIGSLLAAGDIYVDSFPFSSLTSMLEAGSHAIPAVSFRGHPDECAVLGADSPTVDASVLYPDTEERFLATIHELVADEGRRAHLGGELQRVISATHDQSWASDLENLYAFAAPLTTAPNFDSLPSSPSTGPLDVAVEQIQTRTGYAQGQDGAVLGSLGLLALSERLRAFTRLTRNGVKPTARDLLPPAWRTRISRALQRGRAD